MNTIAVITANLGNFDPVVEWVKQDLPEDTAATIIRLTDDDFPPRPKAMTPRLQARIPKMFGWSMFPGFDYYLWVDASCALLSPLSVKYFYAYCQGHGMAVFRHPDRKTIREEAFFIQHKIDTGNKYLKSRYEGEYIKDQLRHVARNGVYPDDRLFASTAFIYKNLPNNQKALKEWWIHTSCYHVVDQLSFPFVLWEFGVDVNVIEDNYLKIPYLTYIRNGKQEEARIP